MPIAKKNFPDEIIDCPECISKMLRVMSHPNKLFYPDFLTYRWECTNCGVWLQEKIDYESRELLLQEAGQKGEKSSWDAFGYNAKKGKKKR